MHTNAPESTITLESTAMLEKHIGESIEFRKRCLKLVETLLVVSDGKNDKLAIFIIVVGSW
jgi:hypothetical protein